MNFARPVALLFALGLLIPAARVCAGDGFFLSVRDTGKRDFYMSVGAHFKRSEREIAFVCGKHIPDHEIPVVFHLAARAKVLPKVIVGMRLSGKSWIQITGSLNLGADVFHVPLKRIPGPPYGNAWGHYKKHPKSAWKRIVLPDADVVTLVNLRFISARHGFTPDEIMSARVRGQNFLSIHANFSAKAKVRAKIKLNGKLKGKLHIKAKGGKAIRHHGGKKAGRGGKHRGGKRGKGRK